MKEIILYAMDRTDLRLKRNNYKGCDRVDIRIYFDKDGDRIPTKKGVSLPVDKVPALIDALRALCEAPDEQSDN